MKIEYDDGRRMTRNGPKMIREAPKGPTEDDLENEETLFIGIGIALALAVIVGFALFAHADCRDQPADPTIGGVIKLYGC